MYNLLAISSEIPFSKIYLDFNYSYNIKLIKTQSVIFRTKVITNIKPSLQSIF
jgi:hypothetical protein